MSVNEDEHETRIGHAIEHGHPCSRSASDGLVRLQNTCPLGIDLQMG